jgi:sigma-B regulation protein RsbU (phosphoserine phosphatase)
MSIGKKILFSLLGLSLLVTLLLCAISIYGFNDIKATFQQENKTAIDDLYEKNVAEITKSSSKLAISLANYYAQTINIDFERIMGELNTMKGDIETLYNSGGTTHAIPISRYEEYIISQAAHPSQQEVNRTLNVLGAATPMFDNILKIEPKISLAYLVLENGMVISSTKTFYPAVEKADMRTRDWYKDAVKAGTVNWSDLYTGTDNRSYVTCATPIHDKKGQLVGVLAFDLRVSEISEKTLNTGDNTYIAAFIMNRQGHVLLSSLDVKATEKQPYFEKFIKNIDLKTTISDYYSDDSSIIGYAPIKSTDWLLVTVLDYEMMMAPVQAVAESVSATGAKMEQVISDETRRVFFIFLIIILVSLPLVFMTATRLSRSITRPVEILADGARVIGEGNLDYEFADLGTDEMGMLATTFNGMIVRLKEYMEAVARSAADKQRLESELEVARDIQLGMLPQQIDCPGYDITGMMVPAKEVGGDFYDFFMLNDQKLCFVVADVSGKGVGAALFMTVAKMVLKTAAQAHNITVDKLLSTANNLLCQENPAELFVTAYVGIMDINSGEIAYACAGHNPPVIVHPDGSSEFVPVKHKLPLAAMEGIQYPIMYTQLQTGETLVLYTDGVTEATNLDEELYGDARLLAALPSVKRLSAPEIIEGIKSNVDIFVGEAPQFDDITIVAIRKIS